MDRTVRFSSRFGKFSSRTTCARLPPTMEVPSTSVAVIILFEFAVMATASGNVLVSNKAVVAADTLVVGIAVAMGDFWRSGVMFLLRRASSE